MIYDIQDAKKELTRVSVKNPPFNIELALRETHIKEAIALMIVFKVKDRDRGIPMDLNFSFDICLPIHNDLFIEYVESRLRAAWLHEFQEMFHIDGIRVSDPHPYPDRPTAIRMTELELLKPLSTEIAAHL